MATFYVSNPEHLYSFSSDELVNLKEEVLEIAKDNELVTIRLQGSYTNPDIYGVFGLNMDEYKNYRRGGGVWHYSPPSHYLQILNLAIEKVLKFEDDVRYFEKEGLI